jgi:mono/diheme cytochrome c family protein
MKKFCFGAFAARRKTLILSAAVALLLSIPPSSESRDFYEHKFEPTEELFNQGKVLYQKQCSVCHGAEGRGDGKAAYLLFPKPRNFVDDKFRLISTTTQKASDDDLFKTISRGMAGSSMPSWEHLSEQDRWALVYYTRYLSGVAEYKKRNGEAPQAGLTWDKIRDDFLKGVNPDEIIKVPSEPAITPEALQLGRELFVASCAGCHGAQGKGDGQQKITDSMGYPAKPRDLTAGIFKADSSSEELYYRMKAGMPGSPMPSYDEVFTPDQIWNLIHFVQSLVPEEKKDNPGLKYNTIVARQISGEIDLNPFAGQWNNVEPVRVSLTPLWWRDDRVEKVDVRAVHNGEEIAFLLSWEDQDNNDNLVEIQSFSDGAAIQLSSQDDPPFFGMGEQNAPVHLWHWKSAWENNGDKRRDIEHNYPDAAVDYYTSQKNYDRGQAFELSASASRFHDPQLMTGWGAGNPVSDPTNESSAEEAMSKGLGTYTTQRPKMEKVDARGVWNNGKWHVIFTRSLTASDENGLSLKAGGSASVAFAIWDGRAAERNGQKSVSIWNSLLIEQSSLTRAGGRN